MIENNKQKDRTRTQMLMKKYFYLKFCERKHTDKNLLGCSKINETDRSTILGFEKTKQNYIREQRIFLRRITCQNL